MCDFTCSGSNHVCLVSRGNWRDWFFVIRTYAQGRDVWHLCCPDISARPQGMRKPSLNSTGLHEAYYGAQFISAMADYRQERAALASVTMKIIESSTRHTSCRWKGLSLIPGNISAS
ncbi:hypothetical protein BKA80DRAFT_324046 [Phyllosticta citrichinensis]